MESTSFRSLTTVDQQQHWWVEIQTQVPACTYFFGPFDSDSEALLLQEGYIDDLVQESAQNITTEIKQIQPQMLTIDNNG
ncbi:DUF1816 domain-containing protein [Vasconcelosia minhoensis]|nr:DUF1816 domain-containing protein [Romeria gracilis]